MRLLPLRFGKVQSVQLLAVTDQMPKPATGPALYEFPQLDTRSLGHYYYTMHSLRNRQAASSN